MFYSRSIDLETYSPPSNSLQCRHIWGVGDSEKRGILGRGKSVPESLQLEDGHGWPPDA